MEKDVRTTLYINEELSKRFREACNKKFGDKQGKIKQGYVLAITNWCDQVEQDGKSIPEPPVNIDEVGTVRFSEEEAKAKKLINKPINQAQKLTEALASTLSAEQELLALGDSFVIKEPVELDQVSFGEKLAQAQSLTKEEVEAKAKKLSNDRKKSSADHKILQ